MFEENGWRKAMFLSNHKVRGAKHG